MKNAIYIAEDPRRNASHISGLRTNLARIYSYITWITDQDLFADILREYRYNFVDAADPFDSYKDAYIKV